LTVSSARGAITGSATAGASGVFTDSLAPVALRLHPRPRCEEHSWATAVAVAARSLSADGLFRAAAALKKG